ncbi:hypothetical protein ACHAWF_006838 [Thalassiosira exigua]
MPKPENRARSTEAEARSATMTDSPSSSPPSAALLFGTLLGFALASWLVWKCLLSRGPAPRPTSASSAPPSSSRRAAAASSAARSAPSAPSAAASSGSAAVASKKQRDDDDDEDEFGRRRLPPHLTSLSAAASADPSGCLAHGVVPFRNASASGYESRLPTEAKGEGSGEGAGEGKKDDDVVDPVVANRRDRARIFARLFAPPARGGCGGRPPNRGSNVVASVGRTELGCEKLQKVLFLLGTYYNLFVVVDASGSEEGTRAGEEGDRGRKALVKRVRDELLNVGKPSADPAEHRLNSEVVPPHRIAAASTTRGRVAFVRQLHGTELVLDADEEVTKELERFKFRALTYPPAEGGGDGGVSALGKFLVP